MVGLTGTYDRDGWTYSDGAERGWKGTLPIMIGGDPAAVAKVSPVLQAMGRTLTHVGGVGSGQITKAINQIIVAGTTGRWRRG